MGYIYIFLTIVLTVYGQLILKWRLVQLGQLPEKFFEKFSFLIQAVFDPYIFSSFFSAFLGSLTWMAALNHFELSKAYPYMSLSYVCVLVLSVLFLHETFNYYKLIGSILIIGGIFIISKA